MTFLRTLSAILIGAVALTSCDKNAVQDITGTLPGARIKFYNFGVNAPSVNFYANDTKVTATSSTTGVEAVTGVAYGSVGGGGLYSAIAPGAYTFTGKIAAAVDKDLAVSRFTSTLADGKAYSLYQSGFYDATAKTSDGFIVEDNFDSAIDFTKAYVRFVNAMSNSQPMILYARETTTGVETAIGGTIAYKAAGAFVPLANGTYELNTRLAGSTANIITRAAVGFSLGRVYTISARGDITVVSTTATNRPFLDNTANR